MRTGYLRIVTFTQPEVFYKPNYLKNYFSILNIKYVVLKPCHNHLYNSSPSISALQNDIHHNTVKIYNIH